MGWRVYVILTSPDVCVSGFDDKDLRPAWLGIEAPDGRETEGTVVHGETQTSKVHERRPVARLMAVHACGQRTPSAIFKYFMLRCTIERTM